MDKSVSATTRASKRSPLDAGLLALYFTCVAYTSAWIFNAAYLFHFGVPLRFAEVNLRDLLLCGFAFVTFLALPSLVVLFWPHKAPAEVKEMLATFFAWLAGALVLTWVAQEWLRFWVAVSAALFFIIWVWIRFVRPIWTHRGLPSYQVKIVTSYRSTASSEDSAIGVFFGRIETRRFKLFALGYAAVVIAGLLGIREARIQEVFLVADECAVIQEESDGFLCADFSDGKLSGTYKYLAAAGILLRRERIGPFPSAGRAGVWL